MYSKFDLKYTQTICSVQNWDFKSNFLIYLFLDQEKHVQAYVHYDPHVSSYRKIICM